MKLTIVTPLYNRANLIENLYNSLKRQTVGDFQWIVVDDGSTDNPKTLFDKWTNEDNQFEIMFIQTPNGGKHRAINHARQYIKGEYYLICDSDDYMTDDGVELACRWISEIEGTELIGVAGLRRTPDGKFFLWHQNETTHEMEIYGGTPHFEGFIDIGPIEANNHGLFGEKVEILNTKIMEKYPFLEFEGENFLTEGIIWNQIENDGLKMRFFDKAVEIGEYQDSGLTKSGKAKFINNPKGYGAYIQSFPEEQRLNKYINYYNELKGILSEEEIAANLNLTDCHKIRNAINAQRKTEIEIIKDSVPIIQNILLQLSLIDKGSDEYDNVINILHSVEALLEVKLSNRDEVAEIMAGNGEMLLNRIEKDNDL